MNMYKTIAQAAMLLLAAWTATAQAAVDSYHYLHVTIDTPWTIFLVLVPMVLMPLILMGVMVWRYAERRKGDEGAEGAAEGKQE
jgi:hypothetical protein